MQCFGPFPKVTYLTSAFQQEISTQCDIIILKLLPLNATVIKAKNKTQNNTRRKKKGQIVGRKVKFSIFQAGRLVVFAMKYLASIDGTVIIVSIIRPVLVHLRV